MNTALRRLATATVAGGTAVILAALPASAHFCFKTELNERAAAGQAGSANWVPLDVLAAEITGLCPEGVAIVVAASGASADTLINIHGTMAGGTLRKGEAGGNTAISYLDFAGIEAAEEDALAACGG